MPFYSVHSNVLHVGDAARESGKRMFCVRSKNILESGNVSLFLDVLLHQAAACKAVGCRVHHVAHVFSV